MVDCRAAGGDRRGADRASGGGPTSPGPAGAGGGGRVQTAPGAVDPDRAPAGAEGAGGRRGDRHIRSEPRAAASRLTGGGADGSRDRSGLQDRVQGRGRVGDRGGAGHGHALPPSARPVRDGDPVPRAAPPADPDRHRERHRVPGDGAGGAFRAGRPRGQPGAGAGQRVGRIGLFGVRPGPRGAAGAGRVPPWRRVHRAPAPGSARGAREDRSQVNRCGSVPARRRPGPVEDPAG